MPVLHRTLALVLLTFGLSAAHAQTAKLVGSWELVADGGSEHEIARLAPVFTFGADGMLQMRFTAPGAIAPQPPDATYRVEGDVIIGTLSGVEQPARYWFEKGDLYIDDGTDVLRLRRTSGC